MLCDYNIEYDRKKIENIQKFIEENKTSKSGKKFSLNENLWLFVNNSIVEIISSEEKNTSQINIKHCGEYKFGDFIFTIEPFGEEINSFPQDSEFKAFVNLSDIDFTLRHRKDGDKIQPLGISGTQKLKKYLNEKKIPTHKKDKLILLCKDNEVLWVAGVGLNDKIKVVNTPTHVLTLKRG